MLRGTQDSLLDLECSQIGEHYGRYRLHQPEAERAMARSLERCGQLSPVVVCRREGGLELIDGFKRLGAVRVLGTMKVLSARLLEADERTAKAAIYGLNRAGGADAGAGRGLDRACLGTRGWIEPSGGSRAVGASQELGMPPAGADRATGARGPRRTAGRVVVAHGSAATGAVAAGQPAGSSRADATRSVVGHRIGRSSGPVAGMSRTQPARVHPGKTSKSALAVEGSGVVRDPRLSPAGNQIWKRVGVLLDLLGRMEVWLTHHGRTELTPGDRAILSSRFQRLSREAFGISDLIVETSTVDLKFTNNKRDADYRIMVAPRNVDGAWELLQVALAASTGDEANSLVVPVYYDDEPTQLSYVGLTRLAEIMKPRFAQLERAFAPENYPATHSRMVEIERLVHPR